MKVLPEDSPEVAAFAGRIFDSYANTHVIDHETHEPTFRAVAAAAIVAATSGETTWFTVLDEAMSRRGVVSRFSSLPPRTRHYLHIASNHYTGGLGKNCRSITELLEMLADPTEVAART